jgi:hypothetical protein
LCVVFHRQPSTCGDQSMTVRHGICLLLVTNWTVTSVPNTLSDDPRTDDQAKLLVARLGRSEMDRLVTLRLTPSPAPGRAPRPRSTHDHKGIRGQGRGTHQRSAPRHPLRWRSTGQPRGEVAGNGDRATFPPEPDS